MKIVSHLLQEIEGIQIYYIIGLLLFFGLFIVILVRTMRMPDKEVNEIKKSILEENDSEKIATS